MNKKQLISIKRKERDITKLKGAGFIVERDDRIPNEIIVHFDGPKDTPY